MNKYAFSGGQLTVEDHRRLGGDLNTDISWKWLNFFLDDDEELAKIEKEYSSGRMLSGEIKAKLIETLIPIRQGHQEAREMVTEETIDAFMSTQPRVFASLFGRHGRRRRRCWTNPSPERQTRRRHRCAGTRGSDEKATG